MLHHQLPPQRFWFWWCDGLQVYDAIIVLVWLALNVLYVEQRVSLVRSLYKSALQPAFVSAKTSLLTAVISTVFIAVP